MDPYRITYIQSCYWFGYLYDYSSILEISGFRLTQRWNPPKIISCLHSLLASTFSMSCSLLWFIFLYRKERQSSYDSNLLCLHLHTKPKPKAKTKTHLWCYVPVTDRSKMQIMLRVAGFVLEPEKAEEGKYFELRWTQHFLRILNSPL